jgi:hypothetical protein
MFCIFLSFRNLPELKLTQDFWSVNILSREPTGDQEINKGGHKAQTSTVGAGPNPGHATHAQMSLGPPMSSIFIS